MFDKEGILILFLLQGALTMLIDRPLESSADIAKMQAQACDKSQTVVDDCKRLPVIRIYQTPVNLSEKHSVGENKSHEFGSEILSAIIKAAQKGIVARLNDGSRRAGSVDDYDQGKMPSIDTLNYYADKWNTTDLALVTVILRCLYIQGIQVPPDDASKIYFHRSQNPSFIETQEHLIGNNPKVSAMVPDIYSPRISIFPKGKYEHAISCGTATAIDKYDGRTNILQNGGLNCSISLEPVFRNLHRHSGDLQIRFSLASVIEAKARVYRDFYCKCDDIGTAAVMIALPPEKKIAYDDVTVFTNQGK